MLCLAVISSLQHGRSCSRDITLHPLQISKTWVFSSPPLLPLKLHKRKKENNAGQICISLVLEMKVGSIGRVQQKVDEDLRKEGNSL